MFNEGRSGTYYGSKLTRNIILKRLSTRCNLKGMQMRFFDESVLAIRAGSRIAKCHPIGIPSRPRVVRTKSPFDYFTDVDINVESAVANVIRKHFPDHGIIGEERIRRNQDSEYVWYIDPIDGTTNLILGSPEIAISLALYRDDEPVLGVLDLPCRGIQVAAHRERKGLIVNDVAGASRLNKSDLDGAVIGLPGELKKNGSFNEFELFQLTKRLFKAVAAVRITGALAYDLACMSLGEMSARVSFRCKTVDIAAGAFIVEHTGGMVTDFDGKPWSLHSKSLIAASSSHLHAAIRELVNDSQEARSV